MRLNFQANPERLAKLNEQTAFKNLATSKKKNVKEKTKDEEEGRKKQEAIVAMLQTLPSILFKDRALFTQELEQAQEKADVKLTRSLRGRY